MAKNTILMIGDGMGWEIARAAAIQKQINAGKSGDTLADFYTQGTGTGLNFQKLAGYGLATTCLKVPNAPKSTNLARWALLIGLEGIRVDDFARRTLRERIDSIVLRF